MKKVKELKAWVESGNLQMIFYSPKTEILEIQFHGGELYQYNGVPAALVLGLVQADSVGGYFARYIKDKYETKKL